MAAPTTAPMRARSNDGVKKGKNGDAAPASCGIAPTGSAVLLPPGKAARGSAAAAGMEVPVMLKRVTGGFLGLFSAMEMLGMVEYYASAGIDNGNKTRKRNDARDA